VYKIKFTGQFKKELKLAKKQGKDTSSRDESHGGGGGKY